MTIVEKILQGFDLTRDDLRVLTAGVDFGRISFVETQTGEINRGLSP